MGTRACRTLYGADGSPLLLRISDAAYQRLSELQRPLRVMVDNGGCHGFLIKFSLEQTPPGPEDIVFERDDARIVVDEISLPLLAGSTVDYKSELIGSAFCVVDNPAARTGCGCGVSFDIKQQNK